MTKFNTLIKFKDNTVMYQRNKNEAFENADFYVRRALRGYTSGPIGD